jgi:hypothetical protein
MKNPRKPGLFLTTTGQADASMCKYLHSKWHPIAIHRRIAGKDVITKGGSGKI